MHSLNNQMIMRTLTPGNGYHKANSETGVHLTCCSQAEAGWETLNNVLQLQWYILSLTQNSNSLRGGKKKSFIVQKIQCEISIFYGSKKNPVLLPTMQSQSDREQGGITAPQSPLCCWKAAPVKTLLFPGVHFQKDHRHMSSKSTRAHQGLEGAGGEEGSWMCCFRGAVTLRNPTQPQAACNHHNGRNYLPTVGQICDLTNLA